MSDKPKFVVYMLPADKVIESMKKERSSRRGGRCRTCGGRTAENSATSVTKYVDGELQTGYFHARITGHDCDERMPAKWRSRPDRDPALKVESQP
jgi:hypothetical protein